MVVSPLFVETVVTVPTRSALVQMDEVEGPRWRQSSEDSVSLASSLAEPINLEGQKLPEGPRSFWNVGKNV